MLLPSPASLPGHPKPRKSLCRPGLISPIRATWIILEAPHPGRTSRARDLGGDRKRGSSIWREFLRFRPTAEVWRGDDEKLLDELGDLLFQVFFLALTLQEKAYADLEGWLGESTRSWCVGTRTYSATKSPIVQAPCAC